MTLPGVKVGPKSGAYLMAPLCSEVVPFGLRVPLRFPARAGIAVAYGRWYFLGSRVE